MHRPGFDLFLRLSLVVPLFVLAGCPSDQTPQQIDMQAACTGNADCMASPFGHVCLSGKCVVCASNLDCPMNQVCDSGLACVDCLASKDCMPGFLCQKKVCVKGCDDNSLCPMGQYCHPTELMCVQCRDSKDCSGDTSKCDLALHKCFNCVVNDDCDPGKVCHQHACTMGCSGDHPVCPMGQVCNVPSGACVACNLDTDCKDPTPRCDVTGNKCVACLPQGDNCPLGNYCKAQMCVGGCRNNADCNVGLDGGVSDNPECDVTVHKCVPCVTDTPCGLGQVCMGQQCVAGCNPQHVCPGAQGCCTGICTDVLADVKNCGGCGKTCATNAGCCGGVCLALDTVANCGKCGNACPDVPNGTRLCAGGGDAGALHCAIGTCNPGFKDCDGNLVNGCESEVSADPANCGACGKVCPAPPNALASCVAAVCGLGPCKPGFAHCGPDPKTGCEINITSDASNCGGCKMACPPPANATPGCAGSKCGIGTCNKNFADCNGDPADGCEISLIDDKKNCGMCGTTCPGTQSCIGGKCALGCVSPTTASMPVPLDLKLSGTDFNFHPQGMTFDTTEGNFDIVLQGVQEIFVVSPMGTLVRTVPLVQVGAKEFKYLTAITVDATNYYLVDYSANAALPPLFKVGKMGGAPTQISTETGVFAGYPMAMNGTTLYRGGPSTKYDWVDVNSIRVSSVGAPDVVTATVKTNVPHGLGDLTWDGTSLWALAFTEPRSEFGDPYRSADLYRIDPFTGKTIESQIGVYTTKAPLVPDALAFANNALWVLNYSEDPTVPGTLVKLGCQ